MSPGNVLNDSVENARYSREVVFGDHETKVIDVEHLIMFSQVRGGRNPESANLEKSIEARGMLNQIDVVRLNLDDLKIYMDFVNSTWDSSLQVEDYLDRCVDDHFYLVAAGHSRTHSAISLQEKDPSTKFRMKCKIHAISSPEDIVALQLDENIHAKVAEEREAMAIVEAYMWGVNTGKWSNRRDFLWAHRNEGKITSSKLEKALGFAQLPHEMRQFVFAGHIPFLAALELGDAMTDLRSFEAKHLGLGNYEDPVAELIVEEAVRLRITEIIMFVSKKKLNSTAAKRYVSALHAAWSDRTESEDSGALFSMVTPEEQATEYLRGRRADIRHHIAEIGSLPAWQAQSLLEMAELFSGIDTKEARQNHHASQEAAVRLLGEHGIQLASN